VLATVDTDLSAIHESAPAGSAQKTLAKKTGDALFALAKLANDRTALLTEAGALGEVDLERQTGGKLVCVGIEALAAKINIPFRHTAAVRRAARAKYVLCLCFVYICLCFVYICSVFVYIFWLFSAVALLRAAYENEIQRRVEEENAAILEEAQAKIAKNKRKMEAKLDQELTGGKRYKSSSS